MKKYILGGIIGLALGLASAPDAAVTKNILTPAVPQPCGGIWNPPCGPTEVGGGEWCCEQGVSYGYKQDRLVTLKGYRCRRAALRSDCGVFEDYISCAAGFAVEERAYIAGTAGLLFDITCRE